MAREYAKVCPACGTTSNVDAGRCRNRHCNRDFAGNEFGVDPLRIYLETESQVLSGAKIASRLAILPGNDPENLAAKKEHRKQVQEQMLESAAGAFFGLILLVISAYLIFPELAGSEPHDASPLADVGGYLAPLGLFLLIMAPFRFVNALGWRLRGPRVASPDESFETFYSELGVGQQKGSVGRAWVCLDPVAQVQYESMEAFERYWANQLSDLKQGAVRATRYLWSDCRPKGLAGKVGCRLAWGPILADNPSERVAEIHRDLLIEVFDDVQVGSDSLRRKVTGSLAYAILVVPQSKTLLKGGDRWYLTSGKLDRPKANLLSREPGPVVARLISEPDGRTA